MSDILMDMDNMWVVVPVQNPGLNLSSFVNDLTGGFIPPKTYEREWSDGTTIDYEYPYSGSPNFTGRIVFVQYEPGYTTYDGVIHLEDFGDYNVYRRQNLGIEYAINQGAESIAVMSSPVKLDPNMLVDASTLLSESFEIVNIMGCAIFILSGKSNLRFDDTFRIWFGDTDLQRRAFDYSVPFTMPFNEVQDVRLNGYQVFEYLEPVPLVEGVIAADEIHYQTKWS